MKLIRLWTKSAVQIPLGIKNWFVGMQITSNSEDNMGWWRGQVAATMVTMKSPSETKVRVLTPPGIATGAGVGEEGCLVAA